MKHFKTPFEWAHVLHFNAIATEHHNKVLAGLMTTVLRHESLGDPTARSHVGAAGIFQIMPSVAKHYHISAYNPHQAADVAATELNMHYHRYHGDIHKPLAAYNYGTGNVHRVVTHYGSHWEQHLPYETREYIHTITHNLPLDSYVMAHEKAAFSPDHITRHKVLANSHLVVQHVEQRLNHLGYACNTTGKFDHKMQHALHEFKQDMLRHGVTVAADSKLDLASVNMALRRDEPIHRHRNHLHSMA